MPTTLYAGSRPLILAVLLLFILALTFVIYYPGLSGPFVFDDIPNIERNSYIAIQDVKPHTLIKAGVSSASSALGRPLSLVSFALNYHAAGLNPFYFKLTNLIIHLANGLGIFILTLLLLDFYRKQFQPGLAATHIQVISLAVAAAWLLHPFNLTGVLYVVQRMTSLSAFFSIWGLALFFWGRIRLYEGAGGAVPVFASFLLFTPLAILSKETGALLPVFMLAAEIVFFNFYAEKPVARNILLGFYICFAAIPIVAMLVYIVMHPQWLLAGYSNRTFSLIERLMTEARVLWFYLWQIILPSNAQMGLYHDDIVNSRGLFKPVSTIFSLAGILTLLGLSFVIRKKAPLIAFGLLFFFAGHTLESTIFPLDIAYEHRNYLPMYGILLMLFFYLLYPLRYLNILRLRQIVAILLISLFSFNTFSRANEWSNPYDLFHAQVEHHPNSVRSNVEMGSIYSNMTANDPAGTEMYYQLSQQYYENAVKLDINDVGGLFGLIMLNASTARIIDSNWLKDMAYRLEHAPYAAITSDKLISLTNCQLQGRCKLPDIEIEALLMAALRNPTATGQNRSKILFALSSYLINVKRDYPGALAVMHEMADLSPYDLEYRFALIKFLTALQRPDEADIEIQKARTMDTQRKHTTTIAELEKQLADIKARQITKEK
ncbi:MAG TPA: hypothetical protein VGK14_07145 [Novimethylophilus sp.]|jgi:hypothetical protein|uniref:hypothetical protein n=1 Tax=Novimethylophilus sp. TaxID=2137426 RepID=UPI002F3F7A1E